MRKRIQTNNDRKEERNAGRGYCCGLRTGTANGAVASVSVSGGFVRFREVPGATMVHIYRGGYAEQSWPCGGFICSEINKDGKKPGNFQCETRHRKCTKK